MAITRTKAAPRSILADELATISVLARRDVVRFFRERSRVIGALAQPALFWLVIGSGMAGTFRMPGAEWLDYRQYFFPGVVVMVVLFTSIFATMSVIEDRHAGFLQAVLVGPGSRTAVALGKSTGATLIALVQAGLFIALAPFAGFSYGAIDWPLLAVVLVLTSIALTSLGFAIAWWLDSTQGYHVVMSLLLLPAWIMSGAMFPPPASRALRLVFELNPMSYAVSGVRRAMHAGVIPPGAELSSAWLELGVLAGFAFAGVALAAALCNRRR